MSAEFQPVRRAHRIHRAVPVELPAGSGVTENFSTADAYILTDAEVLAGRPVLFTLVLDEPASETVIRIECHGTVVRVERRGDRFGFAAVIDSFWIDPHDRKSQVVSNDITKLPIG